MENANEKNYEYLSKVTMSNDKYRDITMITYAKNAAFLQLVITIFALFYIYQLVAGANYQVLCLNSGILFAIAIVMYLSLRRNKIDSFEKSFQTEDGRPIEYDTYFFEDKMEVRLSTGITAEYEYKDIKSVKESEGLYFVEMPKDFHMIVNKNPESNLEENEFKTYILEKAVKVKDKNVVNIAEGETAYKKGILLLGVVFAVSVILLVLHL